MGHSEECSYKDNDALLYGILKMGEHAILVSAREMQVFHEYLEYAKNGDIEISVDMDAAENAPFSIVYGGIMLKNGMLENIRESIDDLKGCALLDLDRNKDDLAASRYEDIVLFPDYSKAGSFIPFAALMQTTHPFDSDDTSVTMFPLYQGNLVWECMVNKPFLLACRNKMTVKDGTTVDNWKSQINMDKLLTAYSVADLYTGPVDDEKIVK